MFAQSIRVEVIKLEYCTNAKQKFVRARSLTPVPILQLLIVHSVGFYCTYFTHTLLHIQLPSYCTF